MNRLAGFDGQIVEYDPSMAENVASMFNELKESFPGGFGGGVPFDEERIRDWLDESSALVNFIALDEEGVPVGYCDLTPHWRDPEAAYIDLLGVIPRVKGEKFGKHLLLKTIERAIEEGIERVDLHTWSGNLNAMPLYKKIGMFWVPETSVYMQDYIPLLHQNDLTREWFEIHENWYRDQKREIKQEPNDLTVDGMNIYRYRFESEKDWMEIDIDRFGFGITGIRRKMGNEKISVDAKIDSHKMYMGIENRYDLEIENETDEIKEVDIEVETFKGMNFDEEFPSSITLDKGESRIISRKFVLDKEAETYESTHEISETIDAVLRFDDKIVELNTGGKIEPAVEIDRQKELDRLFSGEKNEIYFDLKNNTERELCGKISVEIEGEEETERFRSESKENGGFKLPVELDFEDDPVKYIELTPSIEMEDETFDMVSYRHPVVNDSDDLLGCAEKEDEIYLVNDKLKVKVELEGGNMQVNEVARDSKLPYDISQHIGPPFGRTQDFTLRYDYDVEKDENSLLLSLQAESSYKSGLLIKKFFKIKRHSSEVEFWSELKNLSDETMKAASETTTRSWGFDIEPYQSKARVYTPLEKEMIESDPISDMVSGTLVPTDPEKWEETWTAYEDIGDGAFSGLIWDNDNLKKVKLWNGQIHELKSLTEELEPDESFVSTRLWISVKSPSLNAFRDTWNRLVGRKQIHPNERIHGKKSRKDIEVSLKDNIMEKGGKNKTKLIVDKAVDYPMPGLYKLDSPDHLNVSFIGGKDELKVPEEDDSELLELDVEIEVTHDVGKCVDSFVLHFSGERELDFELPLIIESEGEVEIEKKNLEGKDVIHLQNCKISFDVLDGFGGNLIRLEDDEGNTYLDDRFPESKPKSYFENLTGGIEPRLITPEDMYSFYQKENVRSEEIIDGIWKGVKVDFEIEEHDSLRGQNFSIRYLTLPGTKLIKIVLVHDNPTDREIEWLAQLYIDVLLNGSLDDVFVEFPGKYEDWKHPHRHNQFTPPANIERPWFRFEKSGVSLSGFAVEDSPAFSTVICNEEIHMAFLAADMISQAHESERIELGMIIDASKEEIEIARKALSSL